MLLNRTPRIRRAKPLLGTIVDISLYSFSATSESLSSLLCECFERVRRVHSLMSFFDATSEISALNSAHPGENVMVSRETQHVLRFARDLYVDSRGAFDVMHRGRNLFRDAQIVIGSDLTVSRTHPAPIDLGGVAKGFAVDYAAELIEEASDVSGVVNAGGDIRFIGADSFPLAIRSPAFTGHYYDAGHFSRCSVATSAFDSDGSALGVSVKAPSCMVADAMTKIVCRGAIDTVAEVLPKYHATSVVLNGSLEIVAGGL